MKQSSLISLFCLCAAFAPLHCFHAIPAEPSNELPVVLTNLQQIISLKSNELRSARYQAHVRSVIVHVWPATRRIYLQQGKLGLEVALSSSATPFRPGQMVEVNGNVQPALPRPRISAATAKVLSERDLPKPKAASAFSLAAGQDPFRFASLRFIVRDMISHNAGFTLLATHTPPRSKW